MTACEKKRSKYVYGYTACSDVGICMRSLRHWNLHEIIGLPTASSPTQQTGCA